MAVTRWGGGKNVGIGPQKNVEVAVHVQMPVLQEDLALADLPAVESLGVGGLGLGSLLRGKLGCLVEQLEQQHFGLKPRKKIIRINECTDRHPISMGSLGRKRMVRGVCGAHGDESHRRNGQKNYQTIKQSNNQTIK